jgi:hypothetical protein
LAPLSVPDAIRTPIARFDLNHSLSDLPAARPDLPATRSTWLSPTHPRNQSQIRVNLAPQCQPVRPSANQKFMPAGSRATPLFQTWLRPDRRGSVLQLIRRTRPLPDSAASPLTLRSCSPTGRPSLRQPCGIASQPIGLPSPTGRSSLPNCAFLPFQRAFSPPNGAALPPHRPAFLPDRVAFPSSTTRSYLSDGAVCLITTERAPSPSGLASYAHTLPVTATCCLPSRAASCPTGWSYLSSRAPVPPCWATFALRRLALPNLQFHKVIRMWSPLTPLDGRPLRLFDRRAVPYPSESRLADHRSRAPRIA